MLRRDYLLRQVEEFVDALMRMAGLAKAEQWEAASSIANAQFKSLAGAGAGELLGMSGTELIARLAEGDAGYRIQEKMFMVARLFKESGDLLRGQGRIEESHAYYLKGLRLLLGAMADDPASPRPEFLPSLESFLIGLQDSALNLETNALLMRHYEQVREYAKAEDALFDMLDTEAGNLELLDFGVGFYERLLRLDDETLELGNLPRAEVKSGLDELNARKGALVRRQNLER